MVFTAGQLVAHAIGDYVLQSNWMAVNKTGSSVAALAHSLMYGLPFLRLTRSTRALAVIVGSHFVIDHWRLARQAIWLRNFLAPRGANVSWQEARQTGSSSTTPDWLAGLLLIVVDNTLHVVLNAWALSTFSGPAGRRAGAALSGVGRALPGPR